MRLHPAPFDRKGKRPQPETARAGEIPLVRNMGGKKGS